MGYVLCLRSRLESSGTSFTEIRRPHNYVLHTCLPAETNLKPHCSFLAGVIQLLDPHPGPPSLVHLGQLEALVRRQRARQRKQHWPPGHLGGATLAAAARSRNFSGGVCSYCISLGSVYLSIHQTTLEAVQGMYLSTWQKPVYRT